MARLSVGDMAPDVVLYTTSGAEIRTSQLWAEGAAVIDFLRHFR